VAHNLNKKVTYSIKTYNAHKKSVCGIWDRKCGIWDRKCGISKTESVAFGTESVAFGTESVAFRPRETSHTKALSAL